jgi:heme/copper-type cytochrome/quinol oxidase subunit 2
VSILVLHALFNSGAPAHLQPGGTLAIVSELADIDTLPDKLCEWWSTNATLVTVTADATVTTAGTTASSSAVLVHGVPALTAAQYAVRRGGAEYATQWENHLAAERIQHMSQGLIFAVLSNTTTSTTADAVGTDTAGTAAASTGISTTAAGAGAGASSDTVKRSTLQRVEVVAIDKAWAPENTAALQAACDAVSRCSNS